MYWMRHVFILLKYCVHVSNLHCTNLFPRILMLLFSHSFMAIITAHIYIGEYAGVFDVARQMFGDGGKYDNIFEV